MKMQLCMNDLRYDMEIQAFANEGFMVYMRALNHVSSKLNI